MFSSNHLSGKAMDPVDTSIFLLSEWVFMTQDLTTTTPLHRKIWNCLFYKGYWEWVWPISTFATNPGKWDFTFFTFYVHGDPSPRQQFPIAPSRYTLTLVAACQWKLAVFATHPHVNVYGFTHLQKNFKKWPRAAFHLCEKRKRNYHLFSVSTYPLPPQKRDLICPYKLSPLRRLLNKLIKILR